MKKLITILLTAMMIASLVFVPVSAEGSVTLLEAWFEDANGNKVYDTSAVKTVNPVFYVNNSGSEAVTGADLILASYGTDKRIKHVNYVAAPEIPVGESRIEVDATVDTVAGGKTYMMIWKDYDPVVEETVLSDKSCQAEITAASINGISGKFIKKNNIVSLHDIGNKTLGSNVQGYYMYEKRVDNSYKKVEDIIITLPATSDVDITNIDPTFIRTEGTTLNPSGAQDFSNGPIEYTVTAADGVTTKKYNVTVEKISLEYYNEPVDSTFPEITYADAVAAGYNNGKSKTDTIGSLYLEKVRSTTGAYYKKSNIDASKYALFNILDGEKWSDYYADTSATEPLKDQTAATSNSIRYILDKNGNKVLMSNIVVAKDPANPSSDNLVLRYDKRSDSDTASNKFHRKFASSDTTTRNFTRKMSFEFDLYVPKEVLFKENTYFGLGGGGASTSSITTLSIAPTNTGDVAIGSCYAIYQWKSDKYSSQTYSYPLFTIEDGANKWNHVTVDLNYHYNDDKTAVEDIDMTIYINGECMTETTIISNEPGVTLNRAKFVKKTFANWPIWSITGASTTARGTVYLDNLKAYVITH